MAANITCETYVASKRLWVRVAPELTGPVNGRVVNLPKVGWVTDSVAPGERFEWSITASTRAERRQKAFCCLYSQLPSMLRSLPWIPWMPLPAEGDTTVPNIPVPTREQFLVVVVTETGQFTVRLPINSRPR